MTIHFFHIRSAHPGGLPLLLTHGWPDSFLRYAWIFPLLPGTALEQPELFAEDAVRFMERIGC